MLSLRLVIDTNILVSAALNPDGLQNQILLMALVKPARLYVSRPILMEFAGVLARPQFKVHKGARLKLLQQIKNSSHLIEPSRRIRACIDPTDDIFLECADAARADFLVTGNLKHFPPFWRKTKIVTAREFLGLVEPYIMP